MGRIKSQSGKIRGITLIVALLISFLIPSVPAYSDDIPVSIDAALETEGPIGFPDPGLEAAIRYAIDKPTGDIYQSDLAVLTSLDASGYGISDLSGIENCPMLMDLQLRDNNISSISHLSSLTGLVNLDLGNNQISDISPLANLAGLDSLSLDTNMISDISCLSELGSLMWLYLSDNLIADISSLEYLTNLYWLQLEYNRIVDISPLVSNPGLVEGHYVFLVENYLDVSEGSSDMESINALMERGVELFYSPQREISFSISFWLQGDRRPWEGWTVPVTVKFFAPGTDDVLNNQPLFVFPFAVSDGGFVMIENIDPGVYDITLVSPHCLTNLKRGVDISDIYFDVDMGTLLEGDSNDDGQINIADFGLLAAAYATGQGDDGYDARTDFDRSGRINIADFGLLALNYGKYSPIEVEQVE